MHIEVNGLLGILLLVGDVYAIVSTAQSNRSTGAKVAWIVAILLLPALGFILWWLLGPRSTARRNGL